MKQEIIQQLEDVWEVDSGFFWKLRQGDFDKELYNKFLVLLKSISFEGRVNFKPSRFIIMVHTIIYGMAKRTGTKRYKS
ncbi:hypothetical protein A3860_10925 [Niastella vici]|uniref:Uncharacterized protein n=1 Tax=Niastella vici TaxID=1703345 RepID=A0A1V9FFC8_9BACT|nr:hypothetical protein [Niastella vici]OQP57072.1 hypothetical protein A3860_10925 [Niastella vici]